MALKEFGYQCGHTNDGFVWIKFYGDLEAEGVKIDTFLTTMDPKAAQHLADSVARAAKFAYEAQPGLEIMEDTDPIIIPRR